MEALQRYTWMARPVLVNGVSYLFTNTYTYIFCFGDEQRTVKIIHFHFEIFLYTIQLNIYLSFHDTNI